MFANLPLFLSYYPPLILIFAENYNQKHPHMSPITERNGEMMRRGRIEVICGSMFSGKTEELKEKEKANKVYRGSKSNGDYWRRKKQAQSRQGQGRQSSDRKASGRQG